MFLISPVEPELQERVEEPEIPFLRLEVPDVEEFRERWNELQRRGPPATVAVH